jgi:hypothetical protein
MELGAKLQGKRTTGYFMSSLDGARGSDRFLSI